MEEIYLIIENGKVTNLITKADNIKVIVIDLDNRKNNVDPVVDFFTTIKPDQPENVN